MANSISLTYKLKGLMPKSVQINQLMRLCSKPLDNDNSNKGVLDSTSADHSGESQNVMYMLRNESESGTKSTGFSLDVVKAELQKMKMATKNYSEEMKKVKLELKKFNEDMEEMKSEMNKLTQGLHLEANKTREVVEEIIENQKKYDEALQKISDEMKHTDEEAASNLGMALVGIVFLIGYVIWCLQFAKFLWTVNFGWATFVLIFVIALFAAAQSP